MATKTELLITALTDRGMEREHNEDFHGYIPDLEIGESVFFEAREVKELSEKGALLIVADGMGGTNAGEVASRIAVDTVKSFIQQKIAEAMPGNEAGIKSLLMESVKSAQKEIVEHEKKFPETEGMGTTLVVAWVIKNKAYITWVGDSRLYLFNQSGLRQLSHDHSYVQELVDSGKITAEQAFYHPQSNIITQSLGDAKRSPQPGFKTYNIQKGDTILICSDGLNGMVTNSNIEQFMRSNPVPADAARVLIDEANKAGGHDNITVLLAHISNVDEPIPAETGPLSQQERLETPIEVNNEQPPVQPKKSSKRLVLLLSGIIIILLGFLAWEKGPAILKLMNPGKSDSIVADSTGKAKGILPGEGEVNAGEKKKNGQSGEKTETQKDAAGENTKTAEEVEKGKANTETANSMDRKKWEEVKTKDTKAAYKDYLSKFSNGIYKDSATAKIKAINLKFQPVKDALKEVKAGYTPADESDKSRTYKEELNICIKKAEEGTLTGDDIKKLWKAKGRLNGYDGKGVPDLKKAVIELFRFDPDLNKN